MGGDDALAQFRSALFQRDVIGWATGLLMQRDALTETEALRALLRASRVRQTQLACTASSVVDDYISGLPR
jgi:AmiR/NasT family two-component response regulator